MGTATKAESFDGFVSPFAITDADNVDSSSNDGAIPEASIVVDAPTARSSACVQTVPKMLESHSHPGRPVHASCSRCDGGIHLDRADDDLVADIRHRDCESRRCARDETIVARRHRDLGVTLGR